MRLIRHLTVALLLSALLSAVASAGAIPDTEAHAILLADTRTGELLFSKNSSQTTYIASITKLMTAILLVESDRLQDDFAVSHFAASTPPISLYAQPGSSLPGYELLQALLIMSANDVAVIVAEGLAGSVEAFAEKMTQRAHALGAENTYFTNPHGLHDPEHVSTAQDVLVITRHALSLSDIRDICTSCEVYLPSLDRTIRSTNPLLDNYPGAVGLKTGYTRAAGSCLVAVAQRGETELVAIVLDAPLGSAGDEAAAFLDYGFSLYDEYQVIEAGMSLGNAPVEKARHDMGLTAGTSIRLVIRDPALISTKLDVLPLQAPVQAGDELGELKVYYAGIHMATTSVLAERDAPIAWYYRNEIWLVLAFVVLMVMWQRSMHRRRRLARVRAHWHTKRKWFYS